MQKKNYLLYLEVGLNKITFSVTNKIKRRRRKDINCNFNTIYRKWLYEIMQLINVSLITKQSNVSLIIKQSHISLITELSQISHIHAP